MTHLSASASLLYALRVLRSSGIAADSLNDVFRSTVLAKILYCASAWSGMCSPADRSRLDALLKRCKRYGYCDKNLPAIADMFSVADDQLFERVNRNSNHVLEPYLPAKRECCCRGFKFGYLGSHCLFLIICRQFACRH